MIYINPKRVGQGIGIGMVISIMLLLIMEAVVSPESINCSDECAKDSLAELTRRVDEGNLGKLFGYRLICLKENERISSEYLIENSAADKIEFVCSSTVCADGGPLKVSSNEITAWKDCRFRVDVNCPGLGGSYNCKVNILA
jgi:hypothetical protein